MLVRHFAVRCAAVSVIAVLSATLSACSPEQESVPEAQSKVSSTVTIYLTRHGETMLNELERVQGWSDSPLVAAGEQDATDLGEGLKAAGISFDAAYSADMVRHFSTASIALDALGSDLIPTRDERLREVAFGQFEGASNDDMWQFAATQLGYTDRAAMFADRANFSFADALDVIAAKSAGTDLVAETSEELSARALASLHDIAESVQSRGGSRVLVVSSGITIYTLLGALDADLSSVTSGIANAAVSELTYADGAWTIGSVNDLSYVEAGASID